MMAYTFHLIWQALHVATCASGLFIGTGALVCFVEEYERMKSK